MLEALNNFTAATERYVTGKMLKAQFTDAERQFKQKFDEPRERADQVPSMTSLFVTLIYSHLVADCLLTVADKPSVV